MRHHTCNSLLGKLLVFAFLIGQLGAVRIVAAEDSSIAASKFATAKGLTLARWASEPMLMDPVAISFDDQGRMYVAETARRGTVDIDIRAHPEWLIQDLANQSVQDLRQFFRDKMSPANSERNARWLKDLNQDGSHDWKDLTTIRERIRVLEDASNSGKATHSRLLHEGFNEEIGGVLAGVFPWENQLFATAYPSLWCWQDRFSITKSTAPQELFRGFGVHAAFDGHDLHGLIMGPDGKLYFTVGDNGFSITTLEGKRLHHPNTGGVLRMNPDGTELEVFAIGLRNVQEIAFDEFGNCFGVDNDGDLGDERERFVYITEGSDSGWRLNWQFRDAGWAKITGQSTFNPWVDERMWVPHHAGQPAHITPPISNYSVGPGSFTYNPGTGLNDQYRKHFFLIQFPVQKVTAFQTKPSGAGFEMVGEHSVLTGMMASAVQFGPDGALYVADWDGMWNPNGTGSIWRLDSTDTTTLSRRQEVQKLLQIGMKEQGTSHLVRLLAHADMRIRQRAQFELVRRRESKLLLQVATDKTASRLARVHALWGLAQVKAPQRAEGLPLHDDDPEIRAQSAKIAGDLKIHSALPKLMHLLGDARHRVRFHAAMALGKLRNESALPGIMRLAASNDNLDPFIRHAAVFAMAEIGKVEPLLKLKDHPSKAVRIAAVVALRRLAAPQVSEFLKDPELQVRLETVRAIHDDASIPAALPKLVTLLSSDKKLENESLTRRALSAALRLSQNADAQHLLDFALNTGNPDSLRAEAVASLAIWDRFPQLDRVEGQVRRWIPKPVSVSEAGARMLKDNLSQLFKSAGPSMAEALGHAIAENLAGISANQLIEFLEQDDFSASLKAQLLKALAKLYPKEANEIIERYLKEGPVTMRTSALLLLNTTDTTKATEWVLANFKSLSHSDKQSALGILASNRSALAKSLIQELADELAQGALPKELHLETLDAIRRILPKSDAETVKNAYSSRSKIRFAETLYGGDATRGQSIYKNHVSGQCIRCHDAGGVGKQAGPLLAGIGNRATRETILESLIDPNTKIADGFATVTITLKGNEVIDGIQAAETTESVTLLLSSGELQSIPKRSILSKTSSSVSAMPSMAEILSLSEIRDLVEFLANWK